MTKYGFPPSVRPAQLLATAILPVMLAACGAESTGSDDSDTVVTQGVLSKMTPLTVSDREFDDTTSTILHDDTPVAKSSMSPGMRVTVKSSKGVAHSVSYYENVKGPIDYVSADNQTLGVMGQTVTVTSKTWFNGTLESLSSGDIVEVSGLTDHSGEIKASYLHEKTSSVHAYKLHGKIADLNTASQTFMIGGLLIDYSDASMYRNGGTLQNGGYAWVKDRDRSYEPGSLVLNATDVDVKHTHVVHSHHDHNDDKDATATLTGTEHEIEAIITEKHSENLYSAGDTVFRVGEYTKYRHGSHSDLVVGAKVEVEGEKNADGELVAHEVEFSHGSSYYNAHWSVFYHHPHHTDHDDHSNHDDHNNDHDDHNNHDDHQDHDTDHDDHHNWSNHWDHSWNHNWNWDNWNHGDYSHNSWNWSDSVELTGVVKAVDVAKGKAIIGGVLVYFDSSTRFILSDGSKVSADEFFGFVSPEETSVKVKWASHHHKYSGKASEISID